MKFIIISLFLFALVSTGHSAPVEGDDEQLPPIDGFLNPVHPVILNLAKETLIKVQDSLKSAGRVEEALHLNKVLEETEKILEKGNQGVLQSEQFDLDDHLDAIYNALEKYKDYLPSDNSVVLAVSSNNQVHEHLRKQLNELLVRLENKQMPPVPNPNMIIQIIQQLLQYLEGKKAKWYMKKQQFNNIIQAIIDYLRGLIGMIPTPPPPPGLGNNLDNIINGNNRLSPASSSDADLVKSLLDGLLVDLEKIEEGLRKDHKLKEASKIFLHIQIVKSVRSNTHGGNANRKSVDYALNKGMEYVQKYEKYLKSTNHLAMISSVDNEEELKPESDLEKDENDEKNEEEDSNDGKLDEDDLPDQTEEEENLSTLEKIRKQLNELRDRLRKNRKNHRVKVVEAYIRVVDNLIERLKKHQLDNNRFHDFVKRVKEMLEKYADKNKDDEKTLATIAAIVNLLPDNELESTFDTDDLPNEEEEKENLSTLEQFKKQSSELRDRLKKSGKKFRIRVVEAYMRVLDDLIERLKKHKLDNGRFNDFVKRVKELLEKFADSQ